ncbi:MAG: YraN family protein [Marinicella sp.]
MGTISQWLNRAINTLILRKVNRGDFAERKAEKFLYSKGLKILHRNFLTKGGEIDLVMSDGNEWVFIEVRYKQSDEWTDPAESITKQKQQKIIKTAQQYLLKFDQAGKRTCRFDVILMSGDINSPQIEWIQHAFY